MIDQMTYGHYILTSIKPAEQLKTRDKDYIAAGTINWASQISFDPAMVAIAVGRKSDLNETIDYSGHFALHMLGEKHRAMVEAFADDSEVDGDKINGIPYTVEKDEIALENTLGRLVCKVEKGFNAGDHTLYTARVLHQESYTDGTPISTKETQADYSKKRASI